MDDDSNNEGDREQQSANLVSPTYIYYLEKFYKISMATTLYFIAWGGGASANSHVKAIQGPPPKFYWENCIKCLLWSQFRVHGAI